MTRNVGESSVSVTPLVGGDPKSSVRPGEVGLSATSGALSPGLPTHPDDHDPILGDEWEWCAPCLAARHSTFAQLRTIEPGLGPHDPGEFIRAMQEMAREHLRLVAP